jgi:hypothetical protein
MSGSVLTPASLNALPCCARDIMPTSAAREVSRIGQHRAPDAQAAASIRTVAAIFSAISATVSRAVSNPARSGRIPL